MADRSGPHVRVELADTMDTEARLTTETVSTRGPVRWRRQRRPSGAPPPLPRKLGITGAMWIVMLVVVFVAAGVFAASSPIARLVERIDTWWLKVLADVRTPWLTDLAQGIKAAGSGWAVTGLGLGICVVLMVLRRWRHLLV